MFVSLPFCFMPGFVSIRWMVITPCYWLVVVMNKCLVWKGLELKRAGSLLLLILLMMRSASVDAT